MIITNANIITMEDKNYKAGYIIIKGDIIQEIGDMSELKLKKDQQVIDLAGNDVYPGFIDAHGHLGMWEDSVGIEGDDGNEDTDPITPHIRAIDAINPFDKAFSEAASAGITTVVTGPGSSNPIAGECLAIKTIGKRIDDMIVKIPVGIKFSLGENPKGTYSEKNQIPTTRMATAALIREQLEKTKHYIEMQEKAEKDSDFDPPEFDAKCQAMVPIIKRQTKALFHAHRADDIFTAIRIAKQYNLDYVLIHATDGHLIADILASENAQVILGPVICDRSKPELKGHTTKNACILSNNNVPIAICSDHPEGPIQYLNIFCGVSIREGLSRQDALKAITINAAKICGIDDKVGSIAPGKQADFVIYKTGTDPFSVYSKPNLVMIGGKLFKDRGNTID